MLIVRRKAHARAGLIGNPSDGYHGRTISLIVRNFCAEVVLYEWEDVEIVSTEFDQSRFDSVHELVRDVKLHGYYGGLRLIKATIKKFVEYCHAQKLELHDRNFAIRYSTNIPRQVGMAGSSAIIVSTLRCLMDFYAIDIPQEVQPSLVLSVENQELGITAGLQDRVIQVYEGVVYMDFAESQRRTLNGFEHYYYEPIDPKLLPSIYVAYSTDEGEPTEVFHNDIRARFDRNEPAVVNALTTCANLAQQARDALINGEPEQLSQLMDQNFEQRRSIYQLPTGQVRMIEIARSVGASAKFAGSGGAIVGVYRDEQMLHDLQESLNKIGCQVIQPYITTSGANQCDFMK